jgi:hypothetical protein
MQPREIKVVATTGKSIVGRVLFDGPLFTIILPKMMVANLKFYRQATGQKRLLPVKMPDTLIHPVTRTAW